MIVAVTGHRPPKLGGYYIPNPIYLNVKAVLRAAFREQADRVPTGDELMILSGMALGVDQWAAEICIEEGIKWTAVIPFHGFEGRWPDISKRHYHNLLNEADNVHVVTDTSEYRANLLYRRNAWMVDNASLVLAIWNGSSGGTANCIEYARRKRVRTEILPVPLEVWDQARALERGPVRPGGSQLLMNIFRPPGAEQQEASAREAEAARQRNLRAAMNMTNDIFYAQQEEPPTLPSVGDAAGSIAYARRYITEGMQGFIGQPNNANTRAAVQAQAQATMDRLRQQGVMNIEATVRLPQAADYISMDFAVGPDETAVQQRGLLSDLEQYNSNRLSEDDLRRIYGADLPEAAAVAQEPTKKEIITPEKRFLPGRIIDIED